MRNHAAGISGGLQFSFGQLATDRDIFAALPTFDDNESHASVPIQMGMLQACPIGEGIAPCADRSVG
jgi:hypothetical protein